MNSTIDLTAVPVLGVAAVLAILLFAAVGVVYIGERIWMGYRGEMRHRRVEEPEPVVPAEPVAAPEPAVEVHVMRQVDLLPPPPVRLEDAPLARQVPVRLPDHDSYGFHWDRYRPADPYATGSFPEIRAEMEDDLVVPPKQWPGFDVDGVDPRKLPRWSVSRELLAEVAKDLPSQRKATVDLEAGTVVVSQ